MAATKRSPGRPAVGVTEENVTSYRAIISNWIRFHKLDRWLRNPEAWVEAGDEFRKLGFSDRAEKTGDWCGRWLSPEGWKRLQANARQKGYIHGSLTKNQTPRERKKNVQLGETTAYRLKEYAKSYNVTLNDAIVRLLDWEEGQQKELDSFRLEHDRYVWKCSKCKYLVEAESEEKLAKLQSRHKFVECEGEARSWELR